MAADAGSASRCSLWGNECAAGEKCMPWANDGGDEINATRCVPIAEDAKAIGESCTFASELSGIDDCVLGAMCWGGDRGNDGGRCVPFCRGSESNPICDDPCDFCSITGESVFNLCLPSCDPIAQNCTAGEACYPVGDTFRCFMDLSGEQGGVGDPCDHLVQCDPGTFCASAEMVPGCKGAAGCCAPFCDASATDECDAVWPGTTCVPRFGEALGPEACIGTALIGACMVVP